MNEKDAMLPTKRNFFVAVTYGISMWSRKGKVKRFVNFYLQCTVSNLKWISKMSTLPPPGKISADGHVSKRPKDGYASQVEERF